MAQIEQKLDLNDIAKVPAKVSASFKKQAEKAIAIASKILIQQAKQQTDKYGATNSKTFRNAWEVRTTSRFKIYLVNKAPYAFFVEMGRKPGKAPPIKKIRAWVRTRLKLEGFAARRAAYAVQKAISKRGVKARPILRDTMKAAMPLVNAAIQEAFKNAASGCRV